MDNLEVAIFGVIDEFKFIPHDELSAASLKKLGSTIYNNCGDMMRFEAISECEDSESLVAMLSSPSSSYQLYYNACMYLANAFADDYERLRVNFINENS